MKKHIARSLVVAALISGSAVAAGATGGTAVPASTLSFDNSNCVAKFVRAASGIVNETARHCNTGLWADGYILQFRPLNGPPNPACDPIGLVYEFDWISDAGGGTLGAYLPVGTAYHVCVYQAANSVVATGTINSANPDGSSSTVPVTGNYQICVKGTWANNAINISDAKYVSQDGGQTWTDGLIGQWSFLGTGFGEVQINGNFVNWGAYSSDHQYCVNEQLAGGATANLAVFDGDATTNTKNTGWYGDNSGMLSYTITYLGN